MGELINLVKQVLTVGMLCILTHDVIKSGDVGYPIAILYTSVLIFILYTTIREMVIMEARERDRKKYLARQRRMAKDKKRNDRGE